MTLLCPLLGGCTNFPSFSRKDLASIYRFPLIQTEAEKEQEMNLIASKQVISVKQQSRVKLITRDLVQWAEQLVSFRTWILSAH